MRALIVGAGISGLASAVALQRAGLEVTLVERAPQLTEAGAGVVLGPHAMRALDFLGAADHVRAINDPPEASIFYDMLSGEVRNHTALGQAGRDLYGATTYSTHRRDLIDALSARLGGAQLRLGATATDLIQDEHGAALTLATGEVLRGDIAIGADGLRSMARTRLFGESEAVFTGFLAWRTVRPIETLNRRLPPKMSIWIGAGRHVVCYPIRKGSHFYAAFYVPAAEIRREDWSASGDVADLRKSFADACPEVRELTEAIDEAFITGIYYREPLPQWSRDRIVLVGDAAHPVLPTSGSGAAVALEDAVALSACLGRRASDAPGAFEEFEARRKPRTTRLLISSRADLTTFHEADPAKLAVRAPMAEGIMRLDPTGFHRMQWLYGYDEVAESAKPLAEFRKGDTQLPKRPPAQRAFALWAGGIRAEDGLEEWVSERRAYERFVGGLSNPARKPTLESVTCHGVPALRVVPPGCEAGPAVLHLHGGGYVFGSAAAAAGLAARIAEAIGGWALVPDFRLAPEHKARDMQADVRSAYDWLAQRSPRPFVSGECSGGGLAVGLAQALRAEAREGPQAIYLLSPFADLTLSAGSIDGNRASEPWLSRRRLVQLSGAYIQAGDPQDSALSPALGDFSGLPPLRIFAAAGEALADDARALDLAANRAGVDSGLSLIEDSVHSFALFDFLPETTSFLEEIGLHARAMRTGQALTA